MSELSLERYFHVCEGNEADYLHSNGMVTKCKNIIFVEKIKHS